jgi:hypothetical protein
MHIIHTSSKQTCQKSELDIPLDIAVSVNYGAGGIDGMAAGVGEAPPGEGAEGY